MPQIEQSRPANRWWYWIILLLLGAGIIFIPLPAAANQPVDRAFHVDARRFEYSPAVLKVNPGDRVTIELEANDVVHGLSIDGYDLQTTADPGNPAKLTFIADRQGTFRFRCTTTCGNLHPFMIGKLEVGQNTTLWRAMAFAGLALVVGLWKGRR